MGRRLIVSVALLLCLDLRPEAARILAQSAEPDSATAVEPEQLLKTHVYRRSSEGDSLAPVHYEASTLTEILGRTEAGFSFDLGNPGWPSQWSVQTWLPLDVRLRLDGLPVEDPFSARPLYEFVPTSLVSPTRIDQPAAEGAVGVHYHTRPFQAPQPLTEIRYRAGRPGYQFVSATHVQERALGSSDGVVAQGLFSFGAQGWNGEYPNSESDLTRIFSRLSARSDRWSFSLQHRYTRRFIGAHGGVVVERGVLDTVYDRINADVNRPNAQVETKRNVFLAEAGMQLFDDTKPLVAAVGWTRHDYEYDDAPLQRTGKSDAFAVRITQEVPLAPHLHDLTVNLDLDWVQVDTDSLLTDDRSRNGIRFSTTEFVTVRGITVDARAGYTRRSDWSFPVVGLRMETRLYPVTLHASVALSGRTPSRIETVGVEDMIAGAGDLDAVRYQHAEAGLCVRRSVFSLSLTGFVSQTTDAIFIEETSSGSYAVGQVQGSGRRLGISATAGWRLETASGLYGVVRPTLLGAGDGMPEASATAIPEFHLTGRLGYRRVLFQGDLDLDVFLSGRYWSEFSSLRLEPTTGLMVLPASPTLYHEPGVVDIGIKADVRGAQLFVGVENIFADLIYPGTFSVPFYPLVEQKLRFGVYWPITG